MRLKKILPALAALPVIGLGFLATPSMAADEQPSVDIKKDFMIWETREMARISAIQCHRPDAYKAYIEHWRPEIISSENHVIAELDKEHGNTEGLLTDEDNRISGRMMQYFGGNICMVPDSIVTETKAVPYDLPDIAHADPSTIVD